jgi:hypothetical protein
MILNAYTRMLSNSLNNIEVTCFTPGWCKTRMGGDDAPRTAEEGASTAVWLIETDEANRSGNYFADKKLEKWD